MASPIWIVNLGTTRAATPEAVREFLAEFLSDPMVVDYPPWLWRPILSKILRSRPEKVAELYRSIWTEEGSPLAQGTERIAEALRRSVGREVRIAYRYGQPSLREALAEGGVVVSLFPQRTCSTTGSIESALDGGVELRRIAPDDPGYIEAAADLFHRSVGGETPEHFVVSFHGIPVRYDRRERGMFARTAKDVSPLLKSGGLRRRQRFPTSRGSASPGLLATASVPTRLDAG
jgi:ferrochelatase